jgi:uncharacterized coiled-coil protein SlyX
LADCNGHKCDREISFSTGWPDFSKLQAMKTKSLTIPLVMAFGFIALLPKTQAVVPAPDGCYPNYTTAEGCNALQNLVGGAGNTGVGWHSLFSDVNGNFNTGVGAGALILNTADSNTAIGAAAMLLNATGTQNTAVGTDALVYNDTGSGNSAVGALALFSNTTGFNNTAIGNGAGQNLTTGNGNVCIGAFVNGIAGESFTTRIANIGSTPIVGGLTVVVESNGGLGDQRLGYASSSRRYKQEIKPMDKASETLFALKPVTFRAKGNMSPAKVKHYGLIAEDVAAVDSELVVYNPEGKPETLRFDSINAMLLNEFLKEHKKVEEQQRNITQLNSKMANQAAIIAQQQKGMELLTAQLKEQAAQIQKVSTQVELSKAARESVAKNP